MSVNNENASSSNGQTTVLENPEASPIYASLFDKINLTPVSSLGDLNDFRIPLRWLTSLPTSVSLRPFRFSWNA